MVNSAVAQARIRKHVEGCNAPGVSETRISLTKRKKRHVPRGFSRGAGLASAMTWLVDSYQKAGALPQQSPSGYLLRKKRQKSAFEGITCAVFRAQGGKGGGRVSFSSVFGNRDSGTPLNVHGLLLKVSHFGRPRTHSRNRLFKHRVPQEHNASSHK